MNKVERDDTPTPWGNILRDPRKHQPIREELSIAFNPSVRPGGIVYVEIPYFADSYRLQKGSVMCTAEIDFGLPRMSSL